MTRIETIHRAMRDAETSVLRGETATVIPMQDRIRVFADPGSGAAIRSTDYTFHPTPKSGAPVKDLDSGKLGYFYEIEPGGWIQLVDKMENVEKGWSTKNWVELREVDSPKKVPDLVEVPYDITRMD